MALSRNELERLGREAEQGRWVRRRTVYILLVVVFAFGAYCGHLVSVLRQEPPRVQQSAPAPQDQVSPETMSRILSLEEGLKTNPKDVQAWIDLGHLYFDSHMPQQAIRAYTEALKLNPDNPDVTVDMGVMYREIHEHDKALELFESVVKKYPDHQNARFNVGVVLYFDLGKKAEGRAVWEELLRRNPKFKAPNGKPLAEFLKELD